MIPSKAKSRNLLVIVLGLWIGGCSSSGAQRESADGGMDSSSRLAQTPPKEEPPRPADPLMIPGPAPVHYVAPSAQKLDLPPLTSQTDDRREPLPSKAVSTNNQPAPVIPIPNTTPTPETASPELAIPSVNPLRALFAKSSQRNAGTEVYTAHLKRRERVNGKPQPEEEMLFKFRKQPWSVYFKWVGTEHKGREVVFVQGQHESKIHTLTAAGDGLFGASKHWALSPDNLLVRANSRHSITESGFGVLIERFGELLDRIDRGDPTAGSLRYLGAVTRPEFESPVEGVQQNIPPGVEKGLANGGQRVWFFDSNLNLPVLTITTDLNGQELEYYCYSHVELAVRLDDNDFNPTTLWRR